MSEGIPLPSAIPRSQFVDGFQIPAMYSAEAFRSVVQYKPRDDDVFIVTYPKCGSKWAQHIVFLIFRHGKPAESMLEFSSATPVLEITGAEAAETMLRPGAFKIHLPFRLTPWSDKAKYIYITRNPKDTCVSYYHHMLNYPGHGFNGTFDQFFELFLSGKVDHEDYFDHLLEWYEHRNDPNVLFMSYEDIKENPEAAVLKLASFIGEEKYAKPLREDSEMLQNVLKYSSFKYMKEVVNKWMEETYCRPEVHKFELAKTKNTVLASNVSKDGKIFAKNFIRKGIIGDWKNYFNEDQNKRMDKKFSERTKGTDLPNLWKNYM